MERTRQTIMTSEHDSASAASTSLLGNGEVCGARALYPPRLNTDVRMGPAGVVGDSMSGKECRREDGNGSEADIACLTETQMSRQILFGDA